MTFELFGQEFGIFYIISQVFALLTIIFNLIAIQQRKKTRLLNIDTIAAFCSLGHYVFLGAWPGIFNKAVTSVRNATAAYEASAKIKVPKYLPLFFVALYVVLGIITYESPVSLLPMAAATIFTIAIYLCDVRKIRYASVVSNVLWIIYNISVYSVVGVLADVILMINGLVAIYRYRKKKK
ncbi:YgjV family protein [Candidatus Saccharibacteria bacterium]|nr:YgjV family protein [Candidatus Saccharibacteria bacterium]